MDALFKKLKVPKSIKPRDSELDELVRKIEENRIRREGVPSGGRRKKIKKVSPGSKSKPKSKPKSKTKSKTK